MITVAGVGHLPPANLHPPVVVIADSETYEQGDGFKALFTKDHLHILVRVFERECQISVPIEDVLDALARLTRETGS